MVSAFQNLMTDSSDWHPSLNGLNFERIGGEDVEARGGILSGRGFLHPF